MKLSDLANELVMYDQDADVFVREGAELYDFSLEHSDTPGYQDLVLIVKKNRKESNEPEEIDYDAEDTDMGIGTDMSPFGPGFFPIKAYGMTWWIKYD